MENLVILYGGPSSEREVSFSSKDYFLDLYKDRNPILVEWLEDGFFISPSHPEFISRSLPEEKFLHFLAYKKALVIIAGHGEYIEDGYIQQKFEQNGISFTGSNSNSCKLAMNKYKTQEIAKKHVKTIPTYLSYPSKVKRKKIEQTLGSSFPIFVKPNNLGSSVGAYFVESQKQLDELLPKLREIPYVFQKYIEGIELSVGSVRRSSTGFLNLPITGIYPTKSKFFDYAEKYSKQGAKEVTPAKIDDIVTKIIKKTANEIHNALGLGYYSRADFILTKKKDLYYLETNPLPGMSKTSIVPQQLKVSHNVSNFKRDLLKFTN